ncbi:MAG: NAD(P)H-dependent oxidoreductase [Burkholderiales bacterium]|nr:NAD(P)H-dependent oxidoreductase [Burkholderiales bacterium]
MTAASTSPCKHVLFLVGSARETGHLGNTEWLAAEAARALSANTAQTWLHLAALALPPFVDLRHTAGTWPMPESSSPLRQVLDATMAATDVVLVSPVYWFAPPTAIKNYLDHWSAWMRIPGLPFKEAMAGKSLSAVITNGAREKAEPTIRSYEMCAQFLGMRWGGVLWGKGGAPGAVQSDAEAVAAAARFFA